MILNFSSSTTVSGSISDPNLTNDGPISARTSRSLSDAFSVHTPTNDEILKWKNESKMKKNEKIGKILENLMNPVEKRLNNSLQNFSNDLEKIFKNLKLKK